MPKRKTATKAKTEDKRTRRPWLPCPACGSQSSEVVRVMQRVGDRQRRCLACGETYLTIERVFRTATGITDVLPVLESVVSAIKGSPHVAE